MLRSRGWGPSASTTDGRVQRELSCIAWFQMRSSVRTKIAEDVMCMYMYMCICMCIYVYLRTYSYLQLMFLYVCWIHVYIYIQGMIW